MYISKDSLGAGAILLIIAAVVFSASGWANLIQGVQESDDEDEDTDTKQ